MAVHSSPQLCLLPFIITPCLQLSKWFSNHLGIIISKPIWINFVSQSLWNVELNTLWKPKYITCTELLYSLILYFYQKKQSGLSVMICSLYNHPVHLLLMGLPLSFSMYRYFILMASISKKQMILGCFLYDQS